MTPPQSKPFYKKWWFIAIAVLVGLVLIGSLTNPKGKNSTKDAEPSTTSTTTESSADITVPNVVGMRGDEARATLEALGKVDISFKDESGKKMVLDVTNWTVTSQTPEAGATLSKDAKVTLFVHHDTDDAKPTDNPTTEAPSTTDPKKDDVPRDHRKALKSAENYSKTLHMSKQGIYDQLTSEFEGFSPEAAQYAIDNIQADWNANALAKAKEYEKTLNMSDEAIREQLVSEYGEKFTQEEADYAVAHLDD
ncbi:Ltp family lipoprotein [Schaalia odontolytica]|uniref:Ltp family lipoprotein n=1 Tax=Schaalia odontolytica TaxID=1660 RepID=UPI001F51F57E|nr:Ltp family lipoprotein [Schaalia odontolytica]